MLGMGTEPRRGRMDETARTSKRYLSDLTDEAWARIAPSMPPIEPGRAAAARGPARGRDRFASPRALGLRVGDAAGRVRPLADTLLVGPPPDEAFSVPDPPRPRPDGRPAAGRPRGEPLRDRPGQPVGQGAGARSHAGRRCRQDGDRSRAPHRRTTLRTFDRPRKAARHARSGTLKAPATAPPDPLRERSLYP